MKHTFTKNTRPVLGNLNQNSLVLELQDMLTHGSRPELFDRVVASLCDHRLIRVTDEKRTAPVELEGLAHLEEVCDTIESLKRAMKPRAKEIQKQSPVEPLPLKCPYCREVLEGLNFKTAGRFDIGQCPKCGTCLGVVPADSRVEDAPEVPTTETIQ